MKILNLILNFFRMFFFLFGTPLLLGIAALYVMTAKDIQAQATIEGGVIGNGLPADKALVTYTLKSDTTNQYTDITEPNGGYLISDAITSIDDILDTQGRFIADGTVATDLQTGSGNRTIYANVGQPKGKGILYNSIGQKVAEYDMSFQANNLSQTIINLDRFADGMYLFVVQGQEGAGVEKLMNLKGLQAPPLDASPAEILNAKKEMQSTVMGKVTSGTEYNLKIIPTENSNYNFVPLDEDKIIQEGYNFFTHYVTPLTFDNVDFYFTIRSVGDNYAPLANKQVRMYKAGTNTVLGTATTDANGNAVIENVKWGTGAEEFNIEYEVIGGVGHHGAGREFIGFGGLHPDSVKSYQRMLMPETWQDPVTGETLNIDVDDITQWADGVDLMMATKGERRIHFDVTYSVAERNQWRNYNQQFQDRMGIHWNTIEVDNEIEFGDNETYLYLAGIDTSNVFGVNYYKGGDFTIPHDVAQTNGESLGFGAKVWLSMVQAGYNKEEGRVLGLEDISNRDSFMNDGSGAGITSQDAVNINALYTFHIGRFRNGYDNTNLLKMKDN